jgi:hypothetical protein
LKIPTFFGKCVIMELEKSILTKEGEKNGRHQGTYKESEEGRKEKS